jgi:hypothetical protein
MPKGKKEKKDESRVRIRREPPLPKKEINLFFEQVYIREATSAKRLLSKIPDIGEGEKWMKGYVAGMEGMVSSLSDPRSLLARIVDNKVDEKSIQNLLRQFERRTRSSVDHSYDQGCFSAWLDLLEKISRKPEIGPVKTRIKASARTLEEWFPQSTDTPRA